MVSHVLFSDVAIIIAIFYRMNCFEFILRILRAFRYVLVVIVESGINTFCKICDLECGSERQYNQHINGKNHLQKLEKSLDDECTLFVAGFPHGVCKEELCDHFSRYGNVQRCIINKKRGTFGFVEFETTEERNNSMQTVHYIGGRKVYVQPNEQRKNCAGGKSNLDHAAVMEKLENCEKVEQVMEILCNDFSLKKEDFAERQSVCYDIMKTVRMYYPYGDVIVFGSTSNGLGFKGCDVDILFKPTPSFFQRIWAPQQDRNEEVVPSLKSLERGSVYLDDLHPGTHVMLLQRILRARQQVFSKVLYIPARCPIVKLVHVPTGLQCDISCSNMLVVHNTKLLWTYGDMEPRFLHLTMMLRYLAKYHNLVSIGNMSSYSFTMLVVFFLQNTVPPVLPCVQYLQNLADVYEEANGFNCSLCCDVNKIPRSTNKESIGQLLIQFFEFYNSYDFSLVICPFTGMPTERNLFEDSGKDDDTNFQTSPFCIQDPFQLSRNLTSFVHVKTLILLKDWVSSALITLKSADGPYGVRQLLYLFTMNSVKNVSAVVSEELPCRSLVLLNKISVTMSFSPLMQQKIKTMAGSCLGKVCSITTHLLDYCMLFETEIVDQIEIVEEPKSSGSSDAIEQHVSESSSKDRHVGEGDDFEDSPMDFIGEWQFTKFGKQTWESFDLERPQLILSMQCTASYETWFPLRVAVRRKKPKANSANYVSEMMEYIHKISTTMVRRKDRKLADPLNFCLDVLIHREVAGEINLLFVFVPKDGFSDDLVKPIASAFKAHIVNLLEKALK